MPVDTDAARHAMNGAFFHDFAKWGQGDPVAYGRAYYSRYPALSLPYHPPAFPALEAMLFWAFGVATRPARLAVLGFTCVCALLVFQLARRHVGTYAAAAATVAFLTLPVAQSVGGDVMLEFPALSCVLAALCFLPGDNGAWSWRRMVACAAFSAAALWTKQTVFLGAIPFLYALLTRPRALLQPVYAAYGVAFALATVPLALAPRMVGFNGGNTQWKRFGPDEQLLHHAGYYAASAWTELGPLSLLIPAAVLHALWRRRHPALTAWALAAVAFVLLLPPFDERYLFFAWPALLAITAGFAASLAARVSPRRGPVAAACAIALWGSLSLRRDAPYLSGPEEAVEAVAGAPGRILYCGTTNGAFIFALRASEPSPESVVIRCDKLPAGTLAGEGLREFAYRYGVSHVILERRAVKQPWDGLTHSGFEEVRRIALRSSRPKLRGELTVLRALSVSAQPENVLRAPSPITGKTEELRFAAPGRTEALLR